MKTKDMTITRKGCNISVLMAALAVTVFGSSCSDEDFSETSRAPLQLSVTTDTPVLSRAIVNDKYLPDGSQLGVTLTAENGGDYDGKQFFNLKYTASGTEDAQTWSSDEPASLSTTAGKVTAYYPYNPDVTDLTAIPVETASQTDYMYAKPITGINFTSAQTKLTMQHALTDIRISLKKGTYTGTGKVTKVTAKAPGFATGATMHVETGALAGVTGNGAEYIQEFTDLTLTGTAYNQDFLTVPYTNSTSGEVTVFVIVDDKKFNAVIPYTEAFQQGYSYVYNLTLDNSALTLEGVDITKWNVMAKEEQELEFYDNQYIVEIQVPSDGYAYYHNINNYDVEMDWGDGTTEQVKNTSMNSSSTSAYPAHVYEKAGTYKVVATGKINSIRSVAASKIITNIINIGKECNIQHMFYSFEAQKELNTIKKGALDGCTKVTDYSGIFSGCDNLQTIPEGLFNKCTEATDFSNVFAYCDNLQTIPEGLFDNNTKVTDFSYAFRGTPITNIPEGLFDNCTEVKDFQYAFRSCKNLQSIPKGLFDSCTKVTNFRETFDECSSLTVIPAGLFDYCTEVKSFQSTFQGCTSLTSIPKGLFNACINCDNDLSFCETFDGCKSLVSIPEGLFDYTPKVTHFDNTFSNCSALTNIPTGLFDNCTEVIQFANTFYNCTNLQSIPAGLFDYCTKVKSFHQTFYFCYMLKSIPEGLFDSCTEVTDFNYTFYGCDALTTIPEGLFDSCTEVTSFKSTFGGSSYLYPQFKTIPAGLFDNCAKVTSFRGTFAYCRMLQAIPEGLFNNNKLVTDFGMTFYYTKISSIPEGLFDSCTEVTSFANTFANCYALTSIPSGLFDNCTEVTDFGYAFSECTKITSESPYTVINIDGMDTKVHLYERSNYPEYFTAPTSYSSCFYRCTGLTDYDSILTDWK